MFTLFLISPARCNGERAEMLAASKTAAMGLLLRGEGAPIGDVFAWLSALYFRGKLTYARAFAKPPASLPGALVMAPGAGLRSPETRISGIALRAMGGVDVESDAFVKPLRRDAELVDRAYGGAARVVLLGSIATGKYVDTLLEVFGERLVFPGGVRRTGRHEPRRVDAARGAQRRGARVRRGERCDPARRAPAEALEA